MRILRQALARPSTSGSSSRRSSSSRPTRRCRSTATRWAYYFGGLTLFFFVVQVVTGILLLLYYRPTAEAAFESVQFIVTRVPFGWLIRSIHSWSANLMILAAFVHMFSVYLLGVLRQAARADLVERLRPAAGLAMGFGFSGYLLPWNELSFFATRVGTDMVSKVPLAGAAGCSRSCAAARRSPARR